MTIDPIDITIEGYWRNANKSALPRYGGIFLVYECTFIEYNKSVNLKRLLYIGHADNINKSLSNHELFHEWVSQLEKGDELCYGVAKVVGNREEVFDVLKNEYPIIKK